MPVKSETADDIMRAATLLLDSLFTRLYIYLNVNPQAGSRGAE